MSLVLSSGEVCPKCQKPLMRGIVEAHPSRSDLALHNFHCARCGPIKTKIISLKPDEPPSELSA
jgi:RNase P subunit RPR2